MLLSYLSRNEDYLIKNQRMDSKQNRSNFLEEHFFKYFDVTVANTPQLQSEAFKIRYQVYCEELGYEPKEDFPEGMEHDLYDRHSIHCLLRHRSSKKYAACVRIILPDADQPATTFPFEKVSNITDPDINNKLAKNYRNLFCEVSRLAIHGNFRRRKEDESNPEGLVFQQYVEQNSDKRARHQYPVIALGLHGLYISITNALRLDILCIMKKSLSRHLKIYKIDSEQIGPSIEYHGKRAPFILKPREIMNNLEPEVLDLYKRIYKQLAEADSSLPPPTSVS